MFSVVIPVHNKLPHLDRSIHSVLNQTFQDFELILIDDASTDGSSEKLLEYSDPRIRIFRRDTPGPGGYAARNLGIEKAKFDWISFLDADDEWDFTYLNEVSNRIRRHIGVDIISCKYKILPTPKNFRTMPDRQESKFTLCEYLYNRELMWTSAITMRKTLLVKSGLFPLNRCKRGGDMDTWIRCLNNSKLNIFINQTLSYYFRDTVNRVTDEKSNPPQLFCSLNTLKSIKSSTNNSELRKAIDFFSRQSIYSLLYRRSKAGHPVNWDLVKEINPPAYRVVILVKLIIQKLNISEKS